MGIAEISVPVAVAAGLTPSVLGETQKLTLVPCMTRQHCAGYGYSSASVLVSPSVNPDILRMAARGTTFVCSSLLFDS